MRLRSALASGLAAALLLAAPAAAQYDPDAVARVGTTYARAHLALGTALTVAARVSQPAPDDPKRWRFHFSTAVDDAVRDRVAAALASGDAAYRAAQRAIRDDNLSDQSTEMVRGYGLRENDVADVIATALAIASNVTGNAAATPDEVQAAAQQLHAALPWSAGAAALDDPTKQTVATELLYQIVYWQSDWAASGFGRDPAAIARLRASVATSIATLGLDPGHWRIGPSGIVIEAATPSPLPVHKPKPAARTS